MKYNSKQREAVLEIVQKSHDHLTAEEIYERTVDQNLGMSKSTVYRNLNLLTEEGMVMKVFLPTGPDRYDYLERKHNHAVCKVCGRVYDFVCDCMNHQVIESIRQQTEIDQIFDSIVVQGVCKDCKSKNENL